jgi:hypothetical protein
MEKGWSVKQMIREIMLSRAYQMSSSYVAHNDAVDPENKLHWRMSQRRLDAEAIRDSMLAVAEFSEFVSCGWITLWRVPVKGEKAF